VKIPTRTEVVDRIDTRRTDLLVREIRRESVVRNRIEQAALIAEEPIDRRRLNAGRGRDRPRRQRIASIREQQLGRRGDDLRPNVGARLGRVALTRYAIQRRVLGDDEPATRPCLLPMKQERVSIVTIPLRTASRHSERT